MTFLSNLTKIQHKDQVRDQIECQINYLAGTKFRGQVWYTTWDLVMNSVRMRVEIQILFQVGKRSKEQISITHGKITK